MANTAAASRTARMGRLRTNSGMNREPPGAARLLVAGWAANSFSGCCPLLTPSGDTRTFKTESLHSDRPSHMLRSMIPRVHSHSLYMLDHVDPSHVQTK